MERNVYESPKDGLLSIGHDYYYWSTRLTDSSWQMCLAVVAGNWAAYGSLSGVMQSFFAIWSLGLIFFSLAFALAASLAMSEMHRRLHYSAEADWDAWTAKHAAYTAGTNPHDPWPSTRPIEVFGVVARILKTTVPLISGAVLIVGVCVEKPQKVEAQSSHDAGRVSTSLNVAVIVPDSSIRDRVLSPGGEAARHAVKSKVKSR